jgi:NAD+ synthase (glutamine-hydrolysing)
LISIALAQINVTVGDLTGNALKISHAIESAVKAKADVVAFPELALCGYPPEDLLLKTHFIENNLKTINALAKKVHGITAIIGFVDSDSRNNIYNAAAVITDGKIRGVYHKQALPNYGVFDEKRYFTPGNTSGLFDIQGIPVGINICEDIWVEEGIHCAQAKAGAQVIINISSSPYERGKLKIREDLLARRATKHQAYMAYVNLIGGQDELVFDGASMVVAPDGKILARAKQFEEQLLSCVIASEAKQSSHHKDFFVGNKELIAPALDEDEEIYAALVLGTRDYVTKNGFSKVALGLSGGIDSALVAAIAVDAVGKDQVTAISMPSQYNAKATRSDARLLAKNLGLEFFEIPIKRAFAQYLKTLSPWFEGTQPNIAEENLQARIRGNLIMAFANKFNWMVLTTGNKSEMATGYCTLYGDMSGGFAPLKDIFKTKVYELCRWRNGHQKDPLIPKSILLRAPSAELRHDQTDEDSLGSYEQLDQVLAQYIEAHRGAGEIPLDPKYVAKVIKLVDRSEYKRRQAPPGIKITPRAFGKDWRLPITNHYQE